VHAEDKLEDAVLVPSGVKFRVVAVSASVGSCVGGIDERWMQTMMHLKQVQKSADTVAPSGGRSVEDGALPKSARTEDLAGNQMNAGRNVAGSGIHVQPSASVEELFK